MSKDNEKMYELTEELIEQVVMEMKDYIEKMNYHNLYPNESSTAILIDEKSKTNEEKQNFKKLLLESNVHIVKTYPLKDGRDVMIIDDLHGDYNLMKELSKEFFI